MAAKKKAPEKAKSGKKALKPRMEVISESGVTAQEESFLTQGTGIGDGCDADSSPAPLSITEPEPEPEMALTPSQPAALTLPLLTDNATLFIQGVQQLTAQLLGQPECAPLLVCINGWLDALGKVKKLIVGNDDEISGLKKLVIETGEPWGEKGSKQLTLAGVRVPVKAINWRPVDAPLTIADLDPAKVESYLRGNAADPDKVLANYMKGTMTWGLKDLTPLQQKNLTAMLADPGEWGQGLRQCAKDTKYSMMPPEALDG